MTSHPPTPSLADRYRRLPWPVRVLLIVAGVLSAMIVVALFRDPQPTTTRPGAPAEPSSSSPATAAQAAAGIGPGEWLVGVDVQPGTYRSAGPTDGGYCMWSRKDAAGVAPLDNILASDGTFEPGQMLVTIEPGDVVFRTNGCAPWERVS